MFDIMYLSKKLADYMTCPLVMTNTAMKNPRKMDVYSWENYLFLWAMASMAM